MNLAAILYSIALAIGAMIIGLLVGRRDQKALALTIEKINQSDTPQEEKDTQIQNARKATKSKGTVTDVFVIAAFFVAVLGIGAGIYPAFAPEM